MVSLDFFQVTDTSELTVQPVSMEKTKFPLSVFMHIASSGNLVIRASYMVYFLGETDTRCIIRNFKNVLLDWSRGVEITLTPNSAALLVLRNKMFVNCRPLKVALKRFGIEHYRLESQENRLVLYIFKHENTISKHILNNYLKRQLHTDSRPDDIEIE